MTTQCSVTSLPAASGAASGRFRGETLSDADFSRFQRLIERECGIHLGDSKRELMVSRLQRRMRKLEIDSFSDYFALVSGPANGETAAMVDAICTNETSFFRESAQFDYLREQLLPKWIREAAEGKRRRTLRVWSAGCSTGEEPYSLAMLFADRLPLSAGWDVQIIATDISTRVLEAARTAIWPFRQQKDVPNDYLRRFMLQSRDGTRFQATEEIRSMIQFAWLNLIDDVYPMEGPFDMIFCRNVMIYFQPALRLQIEATRHAHSYGRPSLSGPLGNADRRRRPGARRHSERLRKIVVRRVSAFQTEIETCTHG